MSPTRRECFTLRAAWMRLLIVHMQQQQLEVSLQTSLLPLANVTFDDCGKEICLNSARHTDTFMLLRTGSNADATRLKHCVCVFASICHISNASKATCQNSANHFPATDMCKCTDLHTMESWTYLQICCRLTTTMALSTRFYRSPTKVKKHFRHCTCQYSLSVRLIITTEALVVTPS